MLFWFMLLIELSISHIRFRCPDARSCFYGIELDDTDPDGVWRHAPCGHDAVEPVVTYPSGSTICLRVHEFVPHPGYFEIYLSEIAVNRDTSENDADWILLDTIDDPTEDQIKTGIQAFSVDLPTNITCNHCTLQIRQYASDFKWYYYTCSDIKIIDANNNINITNTEDVCIGNDSKWGQTCEWKEAGSLLRITILKDIILGSVGLFCFLILVIVISYTTECCGYQRCRNKCGSYIQNKKANSSLYDTNNDIEMDDRSGNVTTQSNNDRPGFCFKVKRTLKTFWLIHTITWIFIIVSFVIVAIVIIEMKQCNIASDAGNDV